MSYGNVSALDVIAYLAGHGAPATGREISEATGMSRATLYRTLNDLSQSGWLNASGSPRRFAPSWQVTGLGLRMLGNNHVRDITLRSAIDLARETGRLAFVGFLDEMESIVTDDVEVLGGRIMLASVYGRSPALLSSAGRAILSCLPEAETERLLERDVPRPLGRQPNADHIRREIGLARQLGFGVCDGEVEAGRVSLSAPVLDASKQPVASLGVSIRAPRAEVESTMGDIVRQWARRASLELGYKTARVMG